MFNKLLIPILLVLSITGIALGPVLFAKPAPVVEAVEASMAAPVPNPQGPPSYCPCPNLIPIYPGAMWSPATPDCGEGGVVNISCLAAAQAFYNGEALKAANTFYAAQTRISNSLALKCIGVDADIEICLINGGTWAVCGANCDSDKQAALGIAEGQRSNALTAFNTAITAAQGAAQAMANQCCTHQ